MTLLTTKVMEQNSPLSLTQDVEQGSLAWHIRAFVQLMNQRRVLLLTQHGITEADIDILRYLDNHEVKKMKDLGDIFGLKFSTLTSTVDRLEDNRLVKRKSSKDDRRVVFVNIAPRGRSFLQDLSNIYLKTTEDLQKSMTKEQADALNTALESVNLLIEKGGK